MGSIPIRIDKKLVAAARASALAEHRTVGGQMSFWVSVGKATLDNPDLPASFIAECLASMALPREGSSEFVPRSKAKAQIKR